MQISPVISQFDAELLKHFEADKTGAFKNKGGFLGGAAESRGRKLVAMMAYSKLKELAVLHPELIQLSLSETTKQSDNYRMLEELSYLIDKEHESFENVTKELVE